MTNALNLRTITASIAGLSISNLTILDVNAVPTALTDQAKHYLYPAPNGFLANLNTTTDTTGSGLGAYKTIRYTLHYILAYSPVGMGASNYYEYYPDLLDMTAAIVETFLESDAAISGAVDVQVSTGAWGVLGDPTTGQWYGCDVLLNVTEFWEV